jgi:hypothetical protein
VFSDEFNTDGRSFYPGGPYCSLSFLYLSSFILIDDPFWEAVDLQYWPTSDIEWYDPGQITTQNGSLIINMVEVMVTDAVGILKLTLFAGSKSRHELQVR